MISLKNSQFLTYLVLLGLGYYSGAKAGTNEISQPEAYFNGSSYLRLQTTISLKKLTSLSFRTCTGGSLFSQQQNDDLLELSVNGDGVWFFAKTKGKQYEEKILGNFINNKWHLVVLQYRLGNLTLTVDKIDTKLVANATYRSDLLADSGVYNEGAAVLLVGKQFNGCLLQGPSLVFNSSIITSSHNVKFEECPFPEDSCVPRETSKGYDFCLTEPCMRQGTCNNGLSGYTCSCLPRYTGKNCEIDIGNPCDKSPPICKNGATCTSELSGEYNCRCPPDYSGEQCETKIIIQQQCKHNQCLNGGTCVNNGDTIDCICLKGYTGARCELNVDECKSTPCKNGGICIDGVNNYTCDCTHTGYRGANCNNNINECFSSPCLNHGTCFDNYGGYLCQCPLGYDGVNCQFTLNDCVSQPCLNRGSCLESGDGYQCRCPNGFKGKNCELETRNNICDVNTCPYYADCSVDTGSNAIVCNCKHEFPGNYPNCSVEGGCVPNTCKNGGLCTQWKGGFNCTCPQGFTGSDCSVDIDECAEDLSICHEGICVNKQGSFQCFCTPGYTGDRCNLDFDECLSTPCHNNATCLNQINNFQCVCPAGYTSKDCSVDIDECQPMPCQEGATCIDGINDFSCVCQPGLSGRYCEINIDDCESSPCLNNAQCIDGLNSYTCNCTDTGYMGDHCETNIDDCIGNPCANGAECVDAVKNYHCNCYPGYLGKNCDEDINECESNPCQLGGSCIEKSNMTLYHQNFVQKLNVTLPPSFHKLFDYADAAGYECLCVEGVTGSNCEININECESSPCFQGQCSDKIGGYVCECDDGFEGDHCEIDIDECEKYRPCIHGKCMDRKANYYCDCDQNYGGKNCSVELIGCVNNPCLNDGTCKPYLINENKHRFNCSCPNGYHGAICDKISTMSLSGKSLVMINTTRDEGYDIQFRFKTTLGDGLLALGKGLTYYILELSKGRLNLHSSLLNKWEGVFIGSNLNDSQWQRVFVAINSTHLVLSANDEQTIYPITFNENYNATYTSFPLTYIGGIPSNLKKLTHGQPFLVGCTEDVHINGEWVLPENNTVPWLTFQNVDVGCVREPQCNPNPCHSDGHCTDLWRDFRCTCGRPYLGHTCQYNYTAATFGYEAISDSLVTVTVGDGPKRAVRTIVDISMFIRTRQSKGQIFYLGSVLSSTSLIEETYIAAQLESGELLVRIQFNGTPESYTVGGVKLNNGYNHLIEVIRNVTLVQVKLNGTEYFRKTISATGTLDAQVLFLGGQPPLRSVRQTSDANAGKTETVPPTTSAAMITLSNIHFKGIIQDVQISNGSSTMVVEFFPLEAEDLEIPMSFGTVTFDKNNVLEGIHSDDSCKINPCLHSGECENTWNDYRCLCIRGFKGKNCTELEFCELEKCPTGSMCKNLEDGYECVGNATFDGRTPPLKYHLSVRPNASKIITYDKFELTYRTRSWGTAFFAKYLSDYFVIFIYHNEVVIEWNLNNITDTRRFRKDHFEGQWLSLFILYSDPKLKGGFKDSVMDESPNFEVNNFDFAAFTTLLKQGIIYVAGSDNLTFDYRNVVDNADNNTGYVSISETTTIFPMTSNSMESTDQDVLLYKVDQHKKSDLFKGCISEIRLGGLLLPFFTTKELYPKYHNFSEFFELEDESKPEIGCILCYSSDCFNDGHCVNPTETYKCNCTEGYTADDCSIDINECESNQCENNATCEDLIAKYHCNCLPGYEGEFCEKDINECDSNPCKHGGSCVDLINNFKCHCAEGFVGKQCEAPLLITCDNKPCKEGATCKTEANEHTGNNFTCICTEGMEGPFCDTPFCLKKHCENGYCNTTALVPFCECERGYEGKFCEINIDDCVAPTGGSPCQNGGICKDQVNRYECNCDNTGYTGILCEMDIDECQRAGACGGGSTCENLPGSYKCNCDLRTKCGRSCSLDNPCETEHPCVNGECISKCLESSDYICVCNENYTGKNCTDHKVAASESSDGFNILYIVIPIVLVILVAFAIGMAVLVNVARSKRATRGTYSPSAQEFCNPRVELDHVLKPPPEERLI